MERQKYARVPAKTHLEASGCKLDSNGRFLVHIELIAGKARNQIGLSDTGIANEYELEQVVIIIVCLGHGGGENFCLVKISRASLRQHGKSTEHSYQQLTYQLLRDIGR